MTKIRQKSNRTSPKSEKSSRKVNSPSTTTTNGSTHKPTTSNSNGAKYFKHNKKAKLPKEIEEHSEKEKFMKKYGEVMEI